MATISEVLERIRAVNLPVFWLGRCTKDAITGLEKQLGVTLPETFREFLALSGGGEIASSTISGIEDNDPTLENAGTVWGDTLRCREEFGLPAHLVVVYFAEDEICWCLDSSKRDDLCVYRVVSYSLARRVVDREIASTFREFLEEFVENRIRRI